MKNIYVLFFVGLSFIQIVRAAEEVILRQVKITNQLEDPVLVMTPERFSELGCPRMVGSEVPNLIMSGQTKVITVKQKGELGIAQLTRVIDDLYALYKDEAEIVTLEKDQSKFDLKKKFALEPQ